MLEYKVNEFLTLKLEEHKTYIYVNNERRDFTKIFNIHKIKEKYFKYVDSIEEAVFRFDVLDNYNYDALEEDEEISNSSEEEFRDHCSILQTWLDNDFDTSDIGTSLLQTYLLLYLSEMCRYADIDNPLVIEFIKNEITKRIDSGSYNIVLFLFDQSFFYFFSQEEVENFDWDRIFSGFVLFCKHVDNIKYDEDYYDFVDEFNLHHQDWRFSYIDDYISKLRNYLKFLNRGAPHFPRLLSSIKELDIDLQYFIISLLLSTDVSIDFFIAQIILNLIQRLDINLLFQKIIDLFNNTFYPHLNENILLSLKKIGIDLIFFLVEEDLTRGYDDDLFYNNLVEHEFILFEHKWKINFLELLHLFKEKRRYIYSRARIFFSTLWIEDLKLKVREFSKRSETVGYYRIATRNDKILEEISFVYSKYVHTIFNNIEKEDALELLLDNDLWIVETLLGTSNDSKDLEILQDLIPLSLENFVLRWIPEEEAKVLKHLTQISGIDFHLLNGKEVADTPYILVDESRHVVKINLEAVPLSHIPPEIFKLKRLRRLVLTNTRILEVPKEIGDLKDLVELSLNVNKIRTLPESICDLPKLENLSIADNPLTHLPNNFGKLQSLNHLDFYGTNIKTLPLSFFQLHLKDHLYFKWKLISNDEEVKEEQKFKAKVKNPKNFKSLDNF